MHRRPPKFPRTDTLLPHTTLFRSPHPYPDMVARFQSVISQEIRRQLLEKTGRETPDQVIACVGGGSNAMGAFYHFLDDEAVKLTGVEAGGEGVDSDRKSTRLNSSH